MATYEELGRRTVDVSKIPAVPLVGHRSRAHRLIKRAFVHIPSGKPGGMVKVTPEEAARRGYAPSEGGQST